MAIATLEKLYNNADVFTGVVKIRKGLSCKLILHTNSIDELHEIFHDFAVSIQAKALEARKKGANDPNFDRTQLACQKIILLTKQKASARRSAQISQWATMGACLGAALWAKRSPSALSRMNSEWHTYIQLGLVATGAALYWLGPWYPKSNLRPAKEIVREKSI